MRDLVRSLPGRPFHPIPDELLNRRVSVLSDFQTPSSSIPEEEGSNGYSVSVRFNGDYYHIDTRYYENGELKRFAWCRLVFCVVEGGKETFWLIMVPK